ncbi:MAG: hypothetical protein JWP81_168 [Ferruginibacter sp.]|nr:hypothetical protein [Ferruginibacter sp.]
MKKSIAFLAVISVLLLSCNTPRYMYSPSAQNVPVLVKNGDSKLAANYSSDLSGYPFTSTSPAGETKKSNGFDLQGAVAITDHFAIQANYFNRTERNGGNDDNYLDSTVINYKRKLTEFGIGYLKSMHRHDKVMFQVFGGAGKGNFRFTDRGKDQNNIYLLRSHEADVLKVYVQPAFLFRIRENFSMSVSTRFSFINFSNIKTDYTQTELESYQLNDLPLGYRVFFEPAFTNTFGFNKLPGVKFEYQFLTALQISDRTIDYRSFNFSLGILLDIPKMFKTGAGKETD